MARVQLNLIMPQELLTRINQTAGRVAIATGEMPARQKLIRELIERGLDELDALLKEKETTSPE